MKQNECGTAHGHDDNRLELIRISEFAHRLGISIWTARSWAYAGKIASVKLGSLLQVPASEVARLIKENLRPRQPAE
jgi:excisionase family DNA binding protein